MAAKAVGDPLSKGRLSSSISKTIVRPDEPIRVDKAIRPGARNEHELNHQSSRDNSQINCFFKACEREASEKLLRDSYTYSMFSEHVFQRMTSLLR